MRNRKVFNEIYKKHYREVWSCAYRRLKNADLAQDIAQEVFLRLWEYKGKLLNARAWLLRVARNLAEDYAKSAFWKHGTQSRFYVLSCPPSPLDKMAKEEDVTLVKKMLKKLSASDRQLLTLRYFKDYNAQAIADRLKIQITAVHMRLSRARQRASQLFNQTP